MPDIRYTLKTKNFGHLYFGHFNFGQNLSAISPKWFVLSWFFTWLKILSHMRSWILRPFSYHRGPGLCYKSSKFRTETLVRNLNCPKFLVFNVGSQVREEKGTLPPMSNRVIQCPLQVAASGGVVLLRNTYLWRTRNHFQPNLLYIYTFRWCISRGRHISRIYPLKQWNNETLLLIIIRKETICLIL